MTTDQIIEDPNEKLERLAREQMDLNKDWALESVATAIPVGLEEQFDRLDADDELSDDERWRELDVNGAPQAWLPKGLVLITMRNRVDDKAKPKAAFIQTQL
jgi:hypothetical protein